jgi:hypothetical protein
MSSEVSAPPRSPNTSALGTRIQNCLSSLPRRRAGRHCRFSGANCSLNAAVTLVVVVVVAAAAAAAAAAANVARNRMTAEGAGDRRD